MIWEGIEYPSNPCSSCGGDGDQDGEYCYPCLGTGFRSDIGKNLFRKAHDAKIDTLVLSTNVFHSYKILECLDATEHGALTDPQKDGVLHILACGLVDLNDGKAGKTRLWNWFGAESTTVASLTALLS